MNTEALARPSAAPQSNGGQTNTRRSRLTASRARITYRNATSVEAPALHALIEAHREEGRLLPREVEELATHAPRFVVAVRGGQIVGSAELAPLSHRVAEVRSLVVDGQARSLGIGRRLVTELRRRAEAERFAQLCAFTHEEGFFVHLGFRHVPHASVPEKIARDCVSCALFRRCGQHAVVVDLAARE